MPSSLYIVVVGCGRLGSLLASQLSALGASVVVIDQDKDSFSNLSSEFSGFQITGDAAELAVLRQARTDQADVLLAVTEEDNINLMVAQVAQSVFHVRKVIARVFDPSREEVYREFGVDTISPTKLSADAFLEMALGEARSRRE